MDSYLRQSTSQSRSIGPFISSTDFVTIQSGLTINNTNIRLLPNGGTSVTKNSGGGTYKQDGFYSLTFDSTDTQHVGELLITCKMSGALPVFHKFNVVEESVYDSIWNIGPSSILSTNVISINGSGSTEVLRGALGLQYPNLAVSLVNISGQVNSLNNLSQVDIRSAVGLNSSNLDVQFLGLSGITDTINTNVNGLNDLSQADIRTAVGMNSSNLDGQLLGLSGITNGIQTSINNLNDFDPLVDSVNVGNNQDKTGYSIAGTLTTLDLLDLAQDLQHLVTQSGQTIKLVNISGQISSLNDLSESDIRNAVGLGSANLDQQLVTISGQIDEISGLSAGDIRSAIGLNSANLDGQLLGLSGVTTDIQSTVNGLNDLSASEVRTAVGLNSANIDTQFLGLSGITSTINNNITNLNDLSQSEIRGAVGLNSANLDAQLTAMSGEFSGISTQITNLNDFDPTSDQVIVGTNNDKTNYRISGTIQTLDTLDTVQDYQHLVTQSGISELNDISVSDVNTQVDAAIETYGLQYIFHSAYNSASKPLNPSGLFNVMVENDGGNSTIHHKRSRTRSIGLRRRCDRS